MPRLRQVGFRPGAWASRPPMQRHFERGFNTMKIRDLIVKLAALNPEAEVYVWDEVTPDDAGQLVPLGRVLAGTAVPYIGGGFSVDDYSSRDGEYAPHSATPSDTLIVLSE